MVHEKRVGFRDTKHPPRTGAGKMRGEERAMANAPCLLLTLTTARFIEFKFKTSALHVFMCTAEIK